MYPRRRKMLEEKKHGCLKSKRISIFRDIYDLPWKDVSGLIEKSAKWLWYVHSVQGFHATLLSFFENSLCATTKRYTYFKKRCRRERRMAVVERKLHDRKELWFPHEWVLCVALSYTNPTNLHIWQWKTLFLHALHVHFSSFDILKTFSFFLWREMTFFAVVWTTWAYNDKCSILSCPKRWFQFKSRIVKAHFSGIMTLNAWKMIAETRSDSFRWRSRFSRRRVCLSFLLILPHKRPTGPGLIWKTIWLAIESRHCMEPASLELISY